MTYTAVPSVVGIQFTEVHDEPQFAVGTFVETTEGAFEYAQVDEALGIAAGRFAIIGPSSQAIAMNTTDSGSLGQKIGIAVATLADNEYGWFFRGLGEFEALVTNGVAANTQLTTTATDGEAGTGGDTIQGLRNVDPGVTSTRVTVFAASLMSTNV